MEKPVEVFGKISSLKSDCPSSGRAVIILTQSVPSSIGRLRDWVFSRCGSKSLVILHKGFSVKENTFADFKITRDLFFVSVNPSYTFSKVACDFINCHQKIRGKVGTHGNLHKSNPTVILKDPYFEVGTRQQTNPKYPLYI